MGGTSKRDNHGILHGETPVKYRYVFEFDPPLTARKKQADGTRDLSRLEFFGDSEDAFYVLHVALSRMLETPEQLTRSEAVILDEESAVNWTDRNSHEKE